jgi:hypothetical protein
MTQLLLSDEMAGAVDGVESRERLSERIIEASPSMPRRDRFKRYLMTVPAPQLAQRLTILVSQIPQT